MLAYWRQHASSLAYKWGVLDYEIEETERPQFKGTVVVYDEISEENVKVYPTWRRVLKYLISLQILMFLIAIVLYVILG
jgi:hypothetical protein